jgi:hypothetical protein
MIATREGTRLAAEEAAELMLFVHLIEQSRADITTGTLMQNRKAVQLAWTKRDAAVENLMQWVEAR